MNFAAWLPETLLALEILLCAVAAWALYHAVAPTRKAAPRRPRNAGRVTAARPAFRPRPGYAQDFLTPFGHRFRLH
jgi:hypothetical protein